MRSGRGTARCPVKGPAEALEGAAGLRSAFRRPACLGWPLQTARIKAVASQPASKIGWGSSIGSVRRDPGRSSGRSTQGGRQGSVRSRSSRAWDSTGSLVGIRRKAKQLCAPLVMAAVVRSRASRSCRRAGHLARRGVWADRERGAARAHRHHTLRLRAPVDRGLRGGFRVVCASRRTSALHKRMAALDRVFQHGPSAGLRCRGDGQ